MTNPPGYLDGLKDFLTFAPIRNFFKITKCDNCGQKWNGNYPYKYFEYCYTCGNKLGANNE